MPILSRNAKIAIAAVFCSLALFFAVGGTLVWAQTYDGRLGPNTFVGSVEVSGMDLEGAARTVREATDALYANGMPVVLRGKPATVPLTVLAGSDSFDVVQLLVDQSVDVAFDRAHDENGSANVLRLVGELFRENRIGLFVAADEERIRESVRSAFPDLESPAKDAAFVFASGAEGWAVEVTDGAAGNEFDFEPFMTALMSRLADIDQTPIQLTITNRKPEVSREEALFVAEDALSALARAPLALAADDGRTWEVTAEDLATMLVPEREMFPGIGIGTEALDAFLEPVAAEIESEALDARFSVENGRVSEFADAQNGVSINREELRGRIAMAARGDAETTVAIPTTVVEPDVTTEEANDLGIRDVLGVGTSSYRGSPSNRIKNIKNGVRLLNGLLIAPDETFSLLGALKPFDTENGYLSELVIKGDKIEPEIGGGLCQIGTTTFRAVMNSGLQITKRSNHSLVVSYYNDPSNGNPGTDATIYDPAPDFQFTNDTGHYILFQAEMDEATQGLRFTFWGTTDGRKGSYSPPVVLRWIGVGETVNTETLDLAPGKKKCQSAHVGADTTFTYSVVKPDGTVEETVYASHYRPLPEICLVGVEELSTPEDLQQDADSVSSSQTSDVPADVGAVDQTDPQTKTE
ncbi:hypothetical protein A2304_00275 [Candidatus Uhrbacteria bacterium RIFOXYB2_FULL_57_15]|uniref:YoaR-like putative peptidoglycan binding domain-containing protein n=1 Tax=Candidatus Uhrbacteria bacterium RIFOXYB2_FULL_57_15 TaxID=1802422 RepID=A0A1F7W631_9BACT|nr:MAG: hypothetical protein A2304_00275 [Candidatus Uhrbacteria bacterium RIFOXYB2_FULL_57_15]OGL98960.1 MAG: hypothetical protein A2501_02425 [Candidatus Uhrbacteria bacterium RIFOXYC12_FULL_57_11]